MIANIPETPRKRVVIVGAGFGGLTLAQKLAKEDVQVVLIDKNNYHQFQPLFYQVAMAGLEPSSIAFPLRKIFQKKKNIHIRITHVRGVHPERKRISTDLGEIWYNFLVLGMGTNTNFFGMQNIIENAIPMKSVSEAIYLRNRVLENFEAALTTRDPDKIAGLMTMVVVGGGPTGTEISGTLAEMKKMILPKDYPELDFNLMKIYIFESGDGVLKVMSEEASRKGQQYLEELGVTVCTGQRIADYTDGYAITSAGEKIRTDNLIWSAGVVANKIEGFPPEVYGRGGRIKVNSYNQVDGFPDVFAIGDLAAMSSDPAFPEGHPQLAQPAIQQGKLLASNLMKLMNNQPMEPFEYKDLGAMATIGRNKAVVDLPRWKFQGGFAWFVWMFVHLMGILGVKNKVLVFINWFWNYVTYDQSLRLIIRPRMTRKVKTDS